MLILGIDTTEKNINIALTENNKIIGEIEQQNPKNEDIINLIDLLFKNTNKTNKELKGVGVITGPGGYTGTRAGVSVAKTLSQFLDIPIVGFNKLEAVILSYKSDINILPMIDIKRNETYSCIANHNENTINYSLPPQIITLENIIEQLKNYHDSLTVLNYEFKNKQELFSELPENIKVDSEFYLKPSYIALLAEKEIKNGNSKKFYDVSPFYIREAI